MQHPWRCNCGEWNWARDKRCQKCGEDMKGTGEYTKDWSEIAARIKEKAGNKCERCGHFNHYESGHVLTVHHLDGNKSNNADWNLAALCQRCHLHIQGKVFMAQFYMFEHSDWFKPHVEGYYKHLENELKQLTPKVT